MLLVVESTSNSSMSFLVWCHRLIVLRLIALKKEEEEEEEARKTLSTHWHQIPDDTHKLDQGQSLMNSFSQSSISTNGYEFWCFPVDEIKEEMKNLLLSVYPRSRSAACKHILDVYGLFQTDTTTPMTCCLEQKTKKEIIIHPREEQFIININD